MSAAPNKRRTQAERRDEAETKMIAATIELMAERGYNGFSLNDVGEAAGYSRGLPGHYFGPKDRLLAVVAESIVGSYRLATSRLPASARGLPTIGSWLRNHAQLVTTKSSIVLGMLTMEALVRPELRQSIARLNARGQQELANELQAGVEAGNIRADVNIQAQAKLIHSYMRGLLSFCVLERGFGAPAVAEEFVAALARSIGRER